MIEKLLEKNVPTIDYTPEQNKKRLVNLKMERDNIIKKMSNPTIADYQKMFEASKARESKDRSARIKVFSASRRNRLRTSALERVRPAKHTSAYNPMRTKANDIIMRPFTGLGPSEKGKPLQLKAGALWPVLPGRDRSDSGAKPWYRTKNGRIFGEQTLEEMPKSTVILS